MITANIWTSCSPEGREQDVQNAKGKNVNQEFYIQQNYPSETKNKIRHSQITFTYLNL